MTLDVQPFTLNVSDDVLADLKTRLEMARYPQELELPAGEEWSYGTPVDVVKDLVDYWKTDFDWRKAEREINRKLPQYTSFVETGLPEQDTIQIHFAHKVSSRPNAIPLLVVHGWPGNFTEVIKMVDELTEPSDPRFPAFHVIAPSLPGYVFSSPPKVPGFGTRRTAYIFNELMRELGYPHYLAQGGDWGSGAVRALAIWHPDACRGTLNSMLDVDLSLLIRHPFKASKFLLGYCGVPGGYSAAEMDSITRTNDFMANGAAYNSIQKEKPQTLGFALTDSPTGLLAWIVEKFHAWTGRYDWSKDELLTWAMLYWVPGPAPSLRYYRENHHIAKKDQWAIRTEWSNVPLGVSIFKGDIIQCPDDFGSMVQPLKYVKRHDCGGHFAAWETPELLLEDMRQFAQIVVKEDSVFHR